MADVSSIVTNEEVQAIPSIKTVEKTEEIIIKGIEGLITRYCQRIFPQANYSQERHSVSQERGWAETPLSRQNVIRVKNPPITDSGSNLTLEYETDTGSDGTPTTTTIARSTYYADLGSGIITLRNLLTSSATQPASLVGVNTLLSFPEGEGRVLVSYQGGYSAANMPGEVKMAMLMEIARIHKLWNTQKFHEESIQTEFGAAVLLRAGLSPEAKQMLKPFKRPILA